MTNRIAMGILLILVPIHSAAVGATLKPETKAAWDAYVGAATLAMQARLQPGGNFLWLDDEPGRAQRVRASGPYIGPAGAHIPMKVPSGLIHDWLGAGFIPNATIDDILHILRDYDHYKDIYKPGVVGSVFYGVERGKDHFLLRLVNKSAIAKKALDTECEASSVRVDARHWYSISNTIHIHEIDKFGTDREQALPEDEGMGLIWRLSSITRLEERDGGVYAELEAVALSRDIPAAFRILVTPIVRRVSRDSMETSLHQTKRALDEEMARHSRDKDSQ
jgi:hypothetical protein